MNAKSAVILAAAAATASAVTADQAKQLDIIFKDVGSNINQYINLVSDASSGITFDNLPSGLMDIGEEVATNPNDTSYTSKYDEVDLAGVSAFITKLSWYSDRLAPQLDAAGAASKATTVAQATKAQAISQIADGQIQATTATVAQQTENGAAKAVVGLGAGAIAAAALLL
ncbi:hypothetical protein C6P44_000915 [Monosporozyma unispora]|nr:hypothetical protein C6P44_000915 [Kazachstania unispora]